jgi:hypothetical protein
VADFDYDLGRLAISMRLCDFLVEHSRNTVACHAKFPFPHPDELRSIGTANISEFEVGLLEEEWKARLAVRDDTCSEATLKNILEDTPPAAGDDDYLLASFSPKLQVDEGGIRVGHEYK